MTAFADLADLPEDERIVVIGKLALKATKQIAFVVEADGEKADRYIKKLQDQFPRLTRIEKLPGPVANTESVIVYPP